MSEKLPPGMDALLVIANVLNVVYNMPQVVQTYKTRSAGDINKWFLALRIVCSAIWVLYGLFIGSALLMLNNCVTISASVFISYYKVRESGHKTDNQDGEEARP